MFLSPGLIVALLRLLRFFSPPLNSDQQILHFVPPNGDRQGRKDVYDLGNLSPYHDGPTVPGVSANLPDDCTVDQVILLHRHGSRGPVKEQEYILKLVDTLNDARDVIRAVDLPLYLEFLKRGYEYRLVPQELTIVGRKELLDHGIEFALRYPTLSTRQVVSTILHETMDSAYAFSQGFFGREVRYVAFLTDEEFKDTDPVSWLTPWTSCPRLSDMGSSQATEKWVDTYIPPIVNRLNKLVPGVEFSRDAVRGALYACPYDLAARNKSPWCDVFTADELQGLEYELDLSLYSYSRQASSGDAGPLLGAFYIKKLVERLTDTTEDAKPLYLEFADERSILFPLSTMGLNKDAVPPSPDHPRPPAHRKFHSSAQVPFAASMVWERFTCGKTFQGPQVRLVLNGATRPLSLCQQTRQDKTYGTCSLGAFVRANAYSMDVEYGSAVWNATCGL